ncbi:MAG: hypothetical protein HGA76_00635 [Candidatus Firestonebacteria bacterium]|nr:hypothetical protein [Candidatus Firestonebacteria bacterium]
MLPNLQEKTRTEPCTFIEFSHVPKPIKFLYLLKNLAFGVILKRILTKLKVLKKPLIRAKSYPGEVLDLSAGEWVKVKSEQDIQATLDSQQRFKGLYFMPEMRKYCGKNLRVFKRLDAMLVESTHRLIKMKHTVLLEGCHCDGLAYSCDASCFHYWREIWLTRL